MGLGSSARRLVKVIEWTLEVDLLLTGQASGLDDLQDEARVVVAHSARVVREVAEELASASGDVPRSTWRSAHYSASYARDLRA